MSELPDWQPLNGVAPAISEIGGPGRVVVLIASEGATSGGWAAPATLELARSWSREGRRVILIDGALQHPTLHTAAGVPNREGLVDAALHGASVGRVSQAVDDGSFFLIPAGSSVADAQSVARSDRWHRLSSGMTEAGVMVVLFLRDGEEGTPAFMGSASDIVVLAESGEAAPAAVRDLEPLVRAVTGPDADGSLASADSDASLSDGELLAGAGAMAAAGAAAIGVAASMSDGPDPVGGEDMSFDEYDHLGDDGMAGDGTDADSNAFDPLSDVGRGAASVIQAEKKGGLTTMILFVVIAVIVAGGLGYVLWSGMG